MKTIVYKYGLLQPTKSVEVIEEQMRLAHAYYNRLIEIERGRRQRVDALLMPHLGEVPGRVANLEAKLEKAEDAVKRYRSRTRSQNVPDELRGAVKETRKELRAARAELRKERRRAFKLPEIKERLRIIDAEAREESKTARKTSGCYYGTYLIVEQAAAAACKSKTPPKFKRWTGEGALGVQIQNGITPEEVIGGTDRRLQIAPVPETAWKRRRSPEQRTKLKFRVASVNREPVWGEWAMIMHRPLPPKAKIMLAKVVRERLAGRDRWSLHLTLRLPGEWTAEPQAPEGAVAVDIGWRLKDSGVRSGYVVDEAAALKFLKGDDGSPRVAGEEVLVGEEILCRLQKVDDLRSIRDKLLDEMREKLCGWLGQRKIPQWMKEVPKFGSIAKWRSPGKFAMLAFKWRDNRWEGDDYGYALLEEWRKQDKHLWEWEANLRDKVLRRRREGYRILAANLARRYRTLILEDWDLREMQKHKPVESDEVEIKAARLQQRRAAPSELRSCLVSAFAARNGVVVYVDPSYTTLTCAVCGHQDEWDTAENIWHTCRECGAVWDQDSNAAVNMLAAYEDGEFVTKTVDYAAVYAAEKKSRWAKVREKQAAKAAAKAKAAA
jgi:hypothetical protein